MFLIRSRLYRPCHSRQLSISRFPNRNWAPWRVWCSFAIWKSTNDRFSKKRYNADWAEVCGWADGGASAGTPAGWELVGRSAQNRSCFLWNWMKLDQCTILKWETNAICDLRWQDLHAFASLRIQQFSYMSSNIFAFLQFYFENAAYRCPKFTKFHEQFSGFQQFLRKTYDQNFLEDQISWDLPTKIVELFRKWFSNN